MTCLLVFAKAPVAGQAKTRLAQAVGERAAARLAAAALMDTLDAVLATPGAQPAVALSGHLPSAERADELAGVLSRCTVFPQRGTNFADRLANAHADLVSLQPGVPVLQIGMDTPQVTPDLLARSIEVLHTNGVDAALGPAADGGWWALGLRSPADARVLRTVPMSRSDTGIQTMLALKRIGLRVGILDVLSDVDTIADAVRVATLAPAARFSRLVAGFAGVARGRARG